MSALGGSAMFDLTPQQESDAAIVQRIFERTEQGVTTHREVMADEMRPLLRYAKLMTRLVDALVDERNKRQADAMTVGEPEAKYRE